MPAPAAEVAAAGKFGHWRLQFPTKGLRLRGNCRRGYLCYNKGRDEASRRGVAPGLNT